MAKVELTRINNAGSSSGTANINNNSTKIEEAFDNTLSRDGTTPNQMNADIDMNGNDLLNVNFLQAEDVIVDGQQLTSILDSVVTLSNQTQQAKDIAVNSSALAINAATNAQMSAAQAQQWADIALENATGMETASQEEAEAGVLNNKVMTPLRTLQSLNSKARVAAYTLTSAATLNLSTVDVIEVTKFNSSSVVCPAPYAKVAQPGNVEPTHPAKFLSADGYWFELTVDYVVPAMFGVLDNYATGQSAAFQSAVDFCTAKRIPMRGVGRYYRVNFVITGLFFFDGDGCIFRPETNNSVVGIRKIGGIDAPLAIRNFRVYGFGENTSWTNCDAINISSDSTSQDHIDLENIQIRTMPGYGLYIRGGPDSLQVTQRVHCRNVSATRSQYADLRLEGSVIECQFDGCFFQAGCTLGALPIFTDQTTHPQSPAREFRRGSVEILGEYTAPDTGGNNGLTPNRIVFAGCTFGSSQEPNVLGADYRTAAVYYSAGMQITFDTCNFEKPYPGIWFAKETGRGSNFFASTRGVKLSNCRFLALSTDLGLPFPFILYQGVPQTIIEDTTYRGSGNPVLDALIYVDFDSQTANGPFNLMERTTVFGVDVSASVSGYNGNLIKFNNNTYSRTTSISGQTPTRYVAPVFGPVTKIRKGASGHVVDVLGTAYGSNALYTFNEGQRLRLNAWTQVNGSVTLTHNANDGAGSPVPLKGRMMLKGAVDAVLDSDSKFIDFVWEDSSSSWIEMGRNF